MQRYKILHRTYYSFSAAVRLEPHALRLRPREGHELHIESVFRLRPPVSDVISIYRNADAVLLPSFFEGCSNVICEALACGKPVLTSDVCDNSRLVKHGVNGFLFDPHDPDSIADAISHFASLLPASKTAMGRKSRHVAETELNEERFYSEYLDLIETVCKRYAKSKQGDLSLCAADKHP